eukprot:gene28410-35258_t
MHPSEVLFQGTRQPLLLPACDHYAGSEKLMRKSIALQQELGPLFDITFDCEDGASAGNEEAHARLVAELLLSDDNKYNRVGARVHDLHSPHFERDVEIICGAAAHRLAYVVLPKPDSVQDVLRAIDIINTHAHKAKAREKLHAVANKVGYPDSWRDYSAYSVKRDDFAGNVVRGTAFEVRRQLDKIGKPLDRSEWGMTPPTVNAYYNPQMNDINFPAGVLQPPLFDGKMDDAPNYGNTGGTIGHELIHGFDDEGRQFDAKGNLKDWWAKQDAKAFKQRAQCIVDQYAQYTVVDDIKINSKLTLGEDAADLGGLILAWMAWKTEIADKVLENREGLTPEQRFFVGTAQWTCQSERPESLRLHAMTDPHSPGKYRINGVVVNMPEFAKAFACKPGQAMVKPKEKICRVW